MMIHPNSKKIKKSIDGLSLGQFPNSMGLITDDDLTDKQMGSFRGNEKIQDKGDYFLIHRLNNSTKRMNQILQCKKCPLKFPKLCNLRDH